MVKNLTKSYKVFGNNKGKYKHRLNFKNILKLYKSLTKNVY